MDEVRVSESNKTGPLLARANQGDAAAFDELITHVSARLCAISHRMLAKYPQVRRWEETDDVLQMALMRLHGALSDVRPDSVARFFGLASTLLRRIIIDLSRHYYGVYGLGARHQSHAIGSATDEPAGLLENAADEPPESLDAWTAFHQAIEQLSAPERTAFSLMWYGGLTQKQISELLGVSERTVIRRMNRARLQLHELIADQQIFPIEELAMSQEQIEDLLVEWELARQQGRKLELSHLCEDVPHLAQQVEQQIEILKRTSWMLDDPTAEISKDSYANFSYEFEPGVEALGKPGAPGEGASKSAHLGHGNAPAPAVSPQRALPNIPGFRLIHELGRGGFGVVYRAVDEKLERNVAIKLPLNNEPQFHQKYINEARHAAGLDIPGIVPVLHVGTTADGCPFAVQKLIEGESLAMVLRGGGPLSPTQAIRVLVAVCNAVGAAHARALVHRDLKPANILIDQAGMPWVSDFGLAITEDDQINGKGEMAGTPSYMAPEQIQGKVDWLDGRTDIWALGVILYESLTGALPFKASLRTQLHEQILHREPRPICQRVPGLTREWDAIFQKCCAKSIRDRYATAFELAEELAALSRSTGGASQLPANSVLQRLQDAGSNVSAAPMYATGAATVPVQNQVRMLLPLAVAGCALLLLAGGFLASRSWRQPGGAGAETNAAANPAEVVDPRPTSEVTPSHAWVVSADGNGEYQSIQAAVNAADAGQEILIQPGFYRECLLIEKDVSLQAVTTDAPTAIIGNAGPAFTVTSNATLRLAGFSISAESSAEQYLNSIEVHGGSLVLSDCSVTSLGYDCVRLSPLSSFAADGCQFYSARHPAIFADSVEELKIRGCQFELQPTDDDSQDLILVGIQAQQSAGFISECRFTGELATGIEWRDTLNTITVSDCTFQELQRGVAAFGCQNVKIGGAQKTRFVGCMTAIDLEGCGGNIINCDLQAANTQGSTGIKIHGNGSAENDVFHIESSLLNQIDQGIVISQARVTAILITLRDSPGTGITLLDNARLVLAESKILSSKTFGMLIERSSAQLERCEVVENGVAGVVVDGLEQALVAKGCWINGNDVGVILMSGSGEFQNGEIVDNDTGILVARKHRLYHEPTCDAPLQIVAAQVDIAAHLKAVQFLSPGSYRLSHCTIVDPDGQRPQLAQGLTEEVRGDTTFVSIAR